MRTFCLGSRPFGAMLHAVHVGPPALCALLFCVGPASSARGQGLPAADPGSIGLSKIGLAQILPTLQTYVDSGKLSGIVAVIARHGRVGYALAIGSMDIEHHAAMPMNAVFRIYSMTKPIIAAATLKLADDGKLRLDDPVSKFIPAFGATQVYVGGPAGAPVLRAVGRPMTIEHLLTHTAGLSYGSLPGYGALGPARAVDSIYGRANLLNPTRTVREFADSIAQLPLAFSPGEAWNYSMGIDVLGAVIEAASGQTLDSYLTNAIFTPLGMHETAFHILPTMEGRIPIAYSRAANGSLRPPAQLLSPGFLPAAKLLSGGGGLLSTPADYLRFAQMVLNGGELDGRRILNRETVASMMRNHLSPQLTPIESPIIGHSGYGYGLGGAVLVDSSRAGLPGNAGIYRWWGIAGTFFWIDPKADLIGMVWTQFIPGRAFPLEQDFQRLVYAALRP